MLTRVHVVERTPLQGGKSEPWKCRRRKKKPENIQLPERIFITFHEFERVPSGEDSSSVFVFVLDVVVAAALTMSQFGVRAITGRSISLNRQFASGTECMQ